eukprot:g19847.t1
MWKVPHVVMSLSVVQMNQGERRTQAKRSKEEGGGVVSHERFGPSSSVSSGGVVSHESFDGTAMEEELLVALEEELLRSFLTATGERNGLIPLLPDFVQLIKAAEAEFATVVLKYNTGHLTTADT